MVIFQTHSWHYIDLVWWGHIEKTVAKGNSILDFLKRNLNAKSPEVKEKAYKALVMDLEWPPIAQRKTGYRLILRFKMHRKWNPQSTHHRKNTVLWILILHKLHQRLEVQRLAAMCVKHLRERVTQTRGLGFFLFPRKKPWWQIVTYYHWGRLPPPPPSSRSVK